MNCSSSCARSCCRSDTDRAKALVAAGERVGVRDAIHAAGMLNNAVAEIATFDEGFDAIDAVKRARLA